MVNTVKDALDYLRSLETREGNLVDDPELNELLNPYRAAYPFPYQCQRDRCKTTIAYWALHTSGARIAPGPKRVHRKGVRAGEVPPASPQRLGRPLVAEPPIQGGAGDLSFPDLEWKQEFEQPIEWAMTGDGDISLETNPNVGSPWPLRWKFTCPRCGSQYPHTNRQMLDLFLHALYARQRTIRPGTVG